MQANCHAKIAISCHQNLFKHVCFIQTIQRHQGDNWTEKVKPIMVIG